MKRMSIIMMLVAGLFFVSTQNADAGGWGANTTTITGFFVYSTGNAHFKVANPENPDSCITSSYLTLDTSAARFKELYATLMTAYTMGYTVRLQYSGCTSGGNYPVITSIAVPTIW